MCTVYENVKHNVQCRVQVKDRPFAYYDGFSAKSLLLSWEMYHRIVYFYALNETKTTTNSNHCTYIIILIIRHKMVQSPDTIRPIISSLSLSLSLALKIPTAIVFNIL